MFRSTRGDRRADRSPQSIACTKHNCVLITKNWNLSERHSRRLNSLIDDMRSRCTHVAATMKLNSRFSTQLSSTEPQVQFSRGERHELACNKVRLVAQPVCTSEPLQNYKKRLLPQHNQTFFSWRFGLCQRPSSQENCSVLLPGFCHDRDAMWQEIGRTCSSVCSCPRPGSRIVVRLSEYVLPLWSIWYFCPILSP